jgi:hypothetical protein
MKGYNMTKKDYIALAKIIKTNAKIADLRTGFTHVLVTGSFMNELCQYLKNDNPNFDEVKFREATGEILSKEVDCHNSQEKVEKSFRKEVEKRGFDNSKIEFIHIG